VIRVQVKDTSSENILHPTFSTYYKYERLYRTCGGDCARIAASFRRSTFRTARLSQAQLHFSEMCLVLYYGNTRVTKTRAYQLARDILDHRTHGYWIDPERCGKAVPENLVTELLDPTIPMQALLENPEKAALLTQIKMPSRAWFSGYATYLEATPDAGQQLMTRRLGKGVWEQYHLVFETFVHRAQLPLRYVFADHWLVNAWIVDEETRSHASRLWLTLLIDAYSRSILGMALLPEEPCIESIQSALRHTIWHKTSHSRYSSSFWITPGPTIPTAWNISRASSAAMASTTRSISSSARPTRDATGPSSNACFATSPGRSRSWWRGRWHPNLPRKFAQLRGAPACCTPIWTGCCSS
jgi:hypothetical protein